MRKQFILVLLSALPAFAQDRFLQAYGLPVPGVQTSTHVLNGNAQADGFASVWLAYGVMPFASSTVVRVRFYAAATAGTLGSTDLVCDLYNDVTGSPGVSQASSNTVTAVPVAGTPSWVEFTNFSNTGGTTAVTAFTQYWIVVRNRNASPGTNNTTLRAIGGAFPFGVTGGNNGASIKTGVSTGSSVTWSNASSGTVPAYRIEYANSIFAGYPFETTTPAMSLSPNEKIYSTHQAGAVFTTPANFKANAKGCGFFLLRNGAPSGTLACRIYADDGVTLTQAGSDSNNYSATSIDTNNKWVGLYFSSDVVLNPSTKYRVVLVESSQADSNANYYGYQALQVDRLDANTLGLLPIGGTLLGASCPANCTTASNWTTSNNIPVFGLLLDPAGEFAASGGGGARSSASAH